MTTKYDAGRALEYRARDFLTARAYLVVRAAGSKGVADLVALPRIDQPPAWGLGATLLVQCKRGGVLGPAQWNDLVTEALSVSAVPVLASWAPRQPLEFYRLIGFREPARRYRPMVRIFEAVLDPQPTGTMSS